MSAETPIEEVIGWVGEPPGSGVWSDYDGDLHYRAGVDDLAAWLDSIGAWVRVDGKTPWGGLDGFRVVVQQGDRPDIRAYGPTIREALIAAVRKLVAS